MRRLTVIVLVTNEARHIDRFISQFDPNWFDILIVDGFSTDGSLDPYLDAKHIRILTNTFETQGQQFQWALSQLDENVEWMIRLDADELIDANQLLQLYETIGTQNHFVGASFKRKIKFRNKLLRYGGSGEAYCLRLFRRGSGWSDNALMDEKIELDGPVLKSKIQIVDDSRIPFSQWLEKHNNYSSREALSFIMTRHPEIFGTSFGYKTNLARSKIIYYKFPKYIRVFLLFFYRCVILGGYLDGKNGILFLLLQCLYYRWIVDLKISDIEKIISCSNRESDILQAILNNLRLEILCKRN